MCTTALGSLALNALVIDRREDRGEYHSMTRDEFAEMFDRRRDSGVDSFSVATTMASQSVLATACKTMAA